jgi:uncharacterized protein
VDAASLSPELVIAQTVRWLELAVIGLNFCPFAKAVHQKNRIRFVVTDTTQQVQLLETLKAELDHLQTTPIEQTETTLLIHPHALQSFSDFSEFLHVVDLELTIWDHRGEFQIASFHPDYRFSHVTDDHIGNITNRAPYPTLHILRETSVTRATEAIPDVESILSRNLESASNLGASDWHKLMQRVMSGD